MLVRCWGRRNVTQDHKGGTIPCVASYDLFRVDWPLETESKGHIRGLTGCCGTAQLVNHLHATSIVRITYVRPEGAVSSTRT